MNICSFCYSNGESEYQCRSHVLKNEAGLVTCPVLWSYTCPHCHATGDMAHTQSYCPLNKDGRLSSSKGASLVELKKKKNAAGNLPTVKRFNFSDPDYVRASYNTRSTSLKGTMSGGVEKNKMKVMVGAKSSVSSASMNYMFTEPLPSNHRVVTEPLPSVLRPKTPPPALQHQEPESAQLTMYRHYQYLQYYR